MGWWDPGNFEGDEPREYLANVVSYFEGVVEQVLRRMEALHAEGSLADDLEMEPFFPGMEFWPIVSHAGEGCVIPIVATIITLLESLASDYLPAAETVGQWKERYLRLFDLSNPDFDDPAYARKRRLVIEQTFDSLMSLCRNHAGNVARP